MSLRRLGGVFARNNVFKAHNITPNFVFARNYAKDIKGKPVAVVLSGCGVNDGSEIHEAVSVLVQLNKQGMDYELFAPSVQFQPTNHITHTVNEDAESRDSLIESARIARGKIKAVESLNPDEFDAVVFPGGYGVTKILSDYASPTSANKKKKTSEADFSVHPHIDRIIKKFHEDGKPIGAACIAPLLVARVLGKSAGGPGVTLTLGATSPVSKVVTELGNTVETTTGDQVCVDKKNKVISTPAYMVDQPIGKVFDGIGAMVKSIKQFLGGSSASELDDEGRKMIEFFQKL